MGVVISTSSELESGAGFYGFSGSVACSTNTKVVILIQNTGYRDTLLEVTCTGSTDTADVTTGSISNFETRLDDQIIFNTRIMTADPTVLNPDIRTFSFFAPRHSEVKIIQLDSDTTGSCTTMIRGYYMEPPVMQQG
jgi:hypothetical protein